MLMKEHCVFYRNSAQMQFLQFFCDEFFGLHKDIIRKDK